MSNSNNLNASLKQSINKKRTVVDAAVYENNMFTKLTVKNNDGGSGTLHCTGVCLPELKPESCDNER